MSLAEAQRLKASYTALLRQLEYRVKAGLLIDMAMAKGVMFEAIRAQRNAWLAWPARVAPFIAMDFGVDDADRVAGTLQEHVCQQLTVVAGATGEAGDD